MGYAERSNNRFRDKFLAVEVFKGLGTVRRLTADWKEAYNGQHPHSLLGYTTCPNLNKTRNRFKAGHGVAFVRVAS
ncbi:integrase core domain-containing protein [Gimesia sp.]|uniref:integrase core domain-containing protein n=1 Tax=Gimesia sp. TaxID=2024833 RepID=UPI003A9501D2